jgi:capsular polysaccharide biosynthesis protein
VESEEADGQGVLLAFARRWKWLVVGALAGILAAALLVFVLPKEYTATGDLLLHGIDGTEAEQASRMETAAELAHSIPVAERARTRLGGTGEAEALLEKYDASPLTNELLRVEARASSPELAARRVTAVAEAYLDYVTDESDQDLASIERTVEARTAALQTEIAALDTQIAQLGASVDRLTPEQELLLTQRQALATELAGAQTTLNQARADHRLALDRNELVAAPLLPKRPSSPRWREFLVVGLLVGAMLAVGAVLARDVLSRRLFRREELARAAGMSVVASPTLRMRRGRFWRGNERLAKLVTAPPTELSSATGSLTTVLSTGTEPRPSRLVVVSMAAEDEALAIVLRLGMDLAGKLPPSRQRRDTRPRDRTPGSVSRTLQGPGIVVADVTAGDRPAIGPVLRAMRRLTGQPENAELETARSFRVTRTSDRFIEWKPVGTSPDVAEKPDFLIAFAGEWRSSAATVHRLRAVEPGASIIVARSGRVTAANVQEGAAALRHAGAAPLGLIVLNPDRFDSSTGQLDVVEPGDSWSPADAGVATQETERGAVGRM